MGTLDISYIGMVLGLLLMGIPLYFFWQFARHMVRSTLIATARMIVQLAIIGIYFKYLFDWNSPWVNILWLLLITLVATLTAVRRAELKWKVFLIPLGVGLFSTAVLVGIYFLWIVLGLGNPFDARYFVPIMGILMGNMLGVNVFALGLYYDGLKRERQLYYYLLGNGATHFEAIVPFLRKAIVQACQPCIANMAVMGLVSLPGTMIGQILGGTGPGIAVKYQMMIVFITFAASMLSIMITVWLADRRSFDAYGRLLDVRTKKS